MERSAPLLVPVLVVVVAAALLWDIGNTEPDPAVPPGRRAPSAHSSPPRAATFENAASSPDVPSKPVPAARDRPLPVRASQRRPRTIEQIRPPLPTPAAGIRPNLDAAGFITALQEAGETGGLAAFQPPGTSPPVSGVVVPEDYTLPEGFARHYQTTDDGTRLAAILVVAPGYELRDGEGNPIPLERGRVVPPDHAPAELADHLLEIPPVDRHP